MSTSLYVSVPGSHLRLTGERLIVETPQGAPRTVRLRDLDRVVLIGNVGVTSAALTGLLESGIGMSVLRHNGSALGQLSSAMSKDVFTRRGQFEALSDDAWRLRVARRIVSGKLRNARRVVQRHLRNHRGAPVADAIAALQSARLAALRSKSLPSLMGVEGDAARVYFSALSKMLRAEIGFTGRNRRPPRDPANALLSFGYTLLAGEIESAVSALGLDPHVGVLHELDYGRPSLALDLLEEFRQPVVDRLVLTLINRRELDVSDFAYAGSDGGVRMTDAARARFLAAYAQAMSSAAEAGVGGDMRATVRRQAQRMREAIRTRGDYAPWRYV